MTPIYQVRVWQDDGWWLARVVGAADGSPADPLNAITQARSLARIEAMGRDLIATILDAEEDSFKVEFDYVLPGDIGELVGMAAEARHWLNAAQDLWQERSTMAALALAERGYSLREAATLLGLSHQRIDQLLSTPIKANSASVVLFRGPSAEEHNGTHFADVSFPGDVDVILVVRSGHTGGRQEEPQPAVVDPSLAQRVRTVIAEVAWRFSRQPRPT